MKKYKHIFATSGLILGAIIGYSIGWFLNLILFSLLYNIGDSGREGILAWIPFLFGFLPIVIAYGFPIIGAIWGWRHGYKIGKKKDDASK